MEYHKISYPKLCDLLLVNKLELISVLLKSIDIPFIKSLQNINKAFHMTCFVLKYNYNDIH